MYHFFRGNPSPKCRFADGPLALARQKGDARSITFSDAFAFAVPYIIFTDVSGDVRVRTTFHTTIFVQTKKRKIDK